jgi:hypothetical protein
MTLDSRLDNPFLSYQPKCDGLEHGLIKPMEQKIGQKFNFSRPLLKLESDLVVGALI